MEARPRDDIAHDGSGRIARTTPYIQEASLFTTICLMTRDTDCKTYERPSIESCRPLYLTFAHTPTHHEARDEEIPTHAAPIFRSHIPDLCTPRRRKALHPHHGISTALANTSALRLVLDVLGGLLQVEVALLVRPAGTETGADEGGPRAALEKEDGEDDAEADAEGGLDEEVREAAVPL